MAARADSRPVLVAYGSRYGATAEIAELIGAVLREHDLPALVTRAGQAGDLSQYRAAVIGSGIHAGRWTRDAARLLGRGRQVLKTMPLWIFSSGPVGGWPHPGVLPHGVEDKGRRAGARDHALFEGDVLGHRERIRTWAQGVALELSASAAAVA